MPFIIPFKIGQVITNQELCAELKCAPQGGMRRSHATKTLTLISDQTTTPLERNPYQDSWLNGILQYTGMGLKGNQDINFAQNKTLANSANIDINVYLFEVYINREYTYKGQVCLAGEPFQRTQVDNQNNKRNVWIFPLRFK